MYSIPAVITLGKQVQDTLVQYMAITGFNCNKNFDDYYIDSTTVYSLIKALEFENTYPESLSFDEIQNAITKIVEYYYVTEMPIPIFVGSSYDETGGESGTGGVIPSEDRFSYIVTILSNGQTTFTDMPFDIDDVDLESVDLFVEGLASTYDTTPSNNGFHMVGNILYWHDFYELRTGDSIILKWG